MAKRVLWVSRHLIWPEQENWLIKKFGSDVVIEPYQNFKNRFWHDSVSTIAEYFKENGFDELAIAAPDTVIATFISENIYPLRSILAPKIEGVNERSRFREFRKVKERLEPFAYEDERGEDEDEDPIRPSSQLRLALTEERA